MVIFAKNDHFQTLLEPPGKYKFNIAPVKENGKTYQTHFLKQCLCVPF